MFACGLMSVHSASQDMHSQTRNAGVERAEWFPLNAINPLDSFNKGLKIMFYVQEREREREREKRAQCTCNYCAVILKLWLILMLLVG